MQSAILGPVNNRQWWPQPGDYYEVTGVDRDGRRFRKRFSSWFEARCINLWRGSRWLVRDGKRHLLTRL